MKLIKITIFTLLLCVAAGSFANTVLINNTSNHPIAVQYQLAYHSPNQPIKFKEISAFTLHANSTKQINFLQAAYQDAGVVIVAVKKRPTDSAWHNLPADARHYDSTPGCWVNTDTQHPSENIFLGESQSSKHGAHGSFSCKVDTYY